MQEPFGGGPQKDEPALRAGGDARDAWIVVPGTTIAEQWRHRAHPAFLIRLPASELGRVLGVSGVSGIEPPLSRDEESVAGLLANDVSQAEIAAELGMSLRTVQRRVGQLRRRLGAPSTRDLCKRLRTMGYGLH